MAGYATSGRGWHNPAVAGLLRRDERVHAQSIELVDCLCRVIASIGGYFPGDCTDVVSSGPHHQDSGEAKIRESTAGVSRKPSSEGKACGCSSKHLCGLTAWNT